MRRHFHSMMPTRQQFRMALYHNRPWLIAYVCYGRDILSGNVSSGLQNIAAQFSVDWRNWRTVRRNAFPLRRLYQEAILCCIRRGVPKWWDFFPDAQFDSIPALQIFIREYVLRRAGDFEEFRKLRAGIRRLIGVIPSNDAFYDTLAEHYASVARDMDAGLLTQGVDLDRSKPLFVMACAVWGERYVHLLLHYCFPSLLPAGNLEALCRKRQPVMYIHTDPEGREIIEQAEVTRRIKAMGVIVIYQMVNDTLIECCRETADYKSWHLGMVQSLGLYFARTLRADYHMLMPGTVYSDRHFDGLLRAASRGNQAIIRRMLSTRMEGICPDIDAYCHNGVISVSAADLAALSIKHIHPASQAWVVTGLDTSVEVSDANVAVWEGKDTLHILSPYQAILYLDRGVLPSIPKRFFMPLDSELGKIIPEDCPVYCPKPDDEIGLVEVSADKERPCGLKRSALSEFCQLFWHSTQESKAYWPIFREETVDPLNRQLIPGQPYMKDEAIERAKKHLRKAVFASFPATSPEKALVALEVLQKIKVHPKAKPIIALINQTAADLRKKPIIKRVYSEVLKDYVARSFAFISTWVRLLIKPWEYRVQIRKHGMVALESASADYESAYAQSDAMAAQGNEIRNHNKVAFFICSSVQIDHFYPIWKHMPAGSFDVLVGQAYSKTRDPESKEFKKIIAALDAKKTPYVFLRSAITNLWQYSYVVAMMNHAQIFPSIELKHYRIAKQRVRYVPHGIDRLCFGAMSEKFDMFLCQRPYQKEKLMAAFPDKPCVVGGYPRVDALLQRARTGKGRPDKIRNILYLPSHGHYCSLPYFKEALAQLPKNYHLILKPHPDMFYEEENRDLLAVLASQGVEVVKETGRDSDLLEWADAILADYCGSTLLGILLDKPTVFLNSSPSAEEDAGIENELRMHLPTVDPGHVQRLLDILGDEHLYERQHAILKMLKDRFFVTHEHGAGKYYAEFFLRLLAEQGIGSL